MANKHKFNIEDFEQRMVEKIQGLNQPEPQRPSPDAAERTLRRVRQTPSLPLPLRRPDAN